MGWKSIWQKIEGRWRQVHHQGSIDDPELLRSSGCALTTGTPDGDKTQEIAEAFRAEAFQALKPSVAAAFGQSKAWARWQRDRPLMQTATTLPIFFLTLPAGALADAVDRRRILLATQTLMFVAAAMLSGVTFFGAMTPWLLLGLTFALGAGAAVNSPAWQATTVELVPEKDLPAAVTVTGMGLNLARPSARPLAG